MSPQLLGAAAAVMAMAGVYLLFTSTVLGWRGLGPSVGTHRGERGQHLRQSLASWAVQAGLAGHRPLEIAAVVGALLLFGCLAGFVLFGSAVAALATGLALSAAPLSSWKARRAERLAAAREAWPRILEELRLLIGTMGRSVPSALFEAGKHTPEDWRPAFGAAEREWLLTTDFARTAAILKAQLADPTADVVCETLAVAHELGGSEVDARLVDLIEDRILDLQGRKDATSRQAGVRFARKFVLLVPLGMALAGLSIGTGRSAYETTGGQVAVIISLIAVAGCWIWSGRLMRLPQEPRVFR